MALCFTNVDAFRFFWFIIEVVLLIITLATEPCKILYINLYMKNIFLIMLTIYIE